MAQRARGADTVHTHARTLRRGALHMYAVVTDQGPLRAYTRVRTRILYGLRVLRRPQRSRNEFAKHTHGRRSRSARRVSEFESRPEGSTV